MPSQQHQSIGGKTLMTIFELHVLATYRHWTVFAFSDIQQQFQRIDGIHD